MIKCYHCDTNTRCNISLFCPYTVSGEQVCMFPIVTQYEAGEEVNVHCLSSLPNKILTIQCPLERWKVSPKWGRLGVGVGIDSLSYDLCIHITKTLDITQTLSSIVHACTQHLKCMHIFTHTRHKYTHWSVVSHCLSEPYNMYCGQSHLTS